MKVRTIALAVLLASSASAQTLPVRPASYVDDRAGVLKDAARLEESLRAYEQRSTNEFAVLTLANLDGFSSIEEAANKTFHAWGIGKKGKDNGLLLVVAMAEHKYRLEVGYGLEGQLPDARAGQILRDTIPSAFRAGRYDDGLTAAVTQIIAHLDTPATTSVAPIEPASTPTGTNWLLVILSIAGLGGIIALVTWLLKKSREQEEEQNHLIQERIERIRAENRYTDLTRTSAAPIVPPRYVAPRHTEPERRREPERPSYVPVVYPSPDYGSSSSSSDSGSSFGGFGGGDSGGGGASGSW